MWLIILSKCLPLSCIFSYINLLSLCLCTVDIQLPPQNKLKVFSGNRSSVVHRIWFNNTEPNLLLYIGFDTILYPFSGEYLDGNLHITYSMVCDILSCLGPSPVRLPVGTTERCQTVEVTVQGHEGVNGSSIMFKLFDESDNFLQETVIRRVGVHVVGMWYAAIWCKSMNLYNSTPWQG